MNMMEDVFCFRVVANWFKSPDTVAILDSIKPDNLLLMVCVGFYSCISLLIFVHLSFLFFASSSSEKNCEVFLRFMSVIFHFEYLIDNAL